MRYAYIFPPQLRVHKTIAQTQRNARNALNDSKIHKYWPPRHVNLRVHSNPHTHYKFVVRGWGDGGSYHRPATMNGTMKRRLTTRRWGRLTPISADQTKKFQTCNPKHEPWFVNNNADVSGTDFCNSNCIGICIYVSIFNAYCYQYQFHDQWVERSGLVTGSISEWMFSQTKKQNKKAFDNPTLAGVCSVHFPNSYIRPTARKHSQSHSQSWKRSSPGWQL